VGEDLITQQSSLLGETDASYTAQDLRNSGVNMTMKNPETHDTRHAQALATDILWQKQQDEAAE
jgi:hypothetical protein